MPTTPPEHDAFGECLLDHLEGRQSHTLVLESDDGRSTPAMPAGWFFAGPVDWVAWERDALAAARGPVLDLGAGAGRASLFLQERGEQVTAVDHSPGAVDVCRRRGIRDARLADFADTLPDDERWQTVLMLCGNLGLAGGWDATRDLLGRLHSRSAPGAVLLADTVDPTVQADEHARSYQQQQRAAGHYLGRVRLRLRYGSRISLWWDQVNVLIADVPALVADTGWEIDDHHVAGVDHYLKLRRR